MIQPAKDFFPTSGASPVNSTFAVDFASRYEFAFKKWSESWIVVP